MNILVTGGCGFIGSHLVRRLVQEDYKVVVVDNLCTGKLETINDLVESKKVRFIKGDIRLPKLAKQATNDIDAVFHLAALIDARESVEDPITYYFTNVLGTVSMLQASIKNGIKRFLFASTAAVYGDAKSLPLREDSPAKPINPYGESKLLAESYVKRLGKASNLRSVILRIFNVYGSKQHSAYSGVINNFIKRLSEGHSPIIYGDGKQTRDFVHIDDVVDAFLLTLSQDGRGETFNIASGQATSIKELAEIMIRLAGNGINNAIYEDAVEGDIMYSYADISKAKCILEYKPRVALIDGLKSMMQIYQLRHLTS